MGHALAVAMLVLAADFAPALLGPLTGTVSDRFDLKRVMVGCEFAQAGLMVLSPSHEMVIGWYSAGSRVRLVEPARAG